MSGSKKTEWGNGRQGSEDKKKVGRQWFMLKLYTSICLLFCLLAAVSWQGCKVINPHEQTPTYIHVDSFHFVANPSLHNVTTSHQITNVWAYYNDNLVGVFDLPATFPVITNGNGPGKLSLVPGVPVNGLNDRLAAYGFYTTDTFTFMAQPGSVLTHNPTTEFYSKVKIFTIADFESVAPFVLNIGSQPITQVTDDSLVFEGHASGSILLSSPGDSSIDSTAQHFSIPYGQTAIIEFDYKSSVPFYVGLQSNASTISSTPYYLAGISPSDHWQKFYLEVGNFVTQYTGTSYNFYIKTSLPAGQARGRLLLDNIQLVTF